MSESNGNFLQTTHNKCKETNKTYTNDKR